ncbi:MAG: two-component regulator propeller domain-containing protein [Bacteroidota bacterium]
MRRVFLLLLLIGLSAPLQSQTWSQTAFRWFPVQAIQANSRIKAIQKDEQGNIWVGSDDGLILYNGKEVQAFSGAEQIPFIKKIVTTKAGELLIVHDDGLTRIVYEDGVARFDRLLTGSKVQEEDQLFFPKTAYEDRNGVIWIGENEDVVRYRKGRMKRYLFDETAENSDIFSSFSFAEDGYGRLWVLSYTGGMYYYQSGADQFVKVALPVAIDEVSYLLSDGTNQLWVGAEDGVYRMRLGEEAAVLEMERLVAVDRVSKLQFLNEEELLIASYSSGLFQWVKGSGLARVTQISDADIIDFYVNERSVWVASNERIDVLNFLPFAIVTATADRDIPSIALSEDNKVIACDGERIFFLQKRFDGFQMEKVFDTQRQFFINKAIQRKRNLWLAASHGVIYRYNLDSKELKELYRGESEDWLIDIYMDQRQSLWAFNRVSEKVIEIDSSFSITAHENLRECWQMKENAAGELIAMGRSPKVMVRAAGAQRFKTYAIAFEEEVQIIYDFDLNGAYILLATDKGLYRIPSQFKSGDEPITPKLLYSGVVRSVAAADGGVLWFGDLNGLVRKEVDRISYFDQNNGLPSRRVTERGMLIDQNDELWVATGKGVGFVANKMLLQAKTPTPQLIQLKQDGRIEDAQGSDLGVIPSSSILQLSFALISFPAENVTYQALLSNSNGEEQIIHEGDAYFSLIGLPPDDYELKVSAKQLSGRRWSEPVLLQFTIKQPFYQTSLFYLLLTLLGFGLVVAGTQWYNRQLKRSNQKLDQLVKERTHLLNEQKDKLLKQQEELLRQKHDLIEKNTILNETKDALVSAETRYLALKDEQLQNEIDLKNKQLTTHALTLIQKNQALKEISELINVALRKKENQEIVADLRQIGKQIEQASDGDEKWDEFRLYFEQVYTGFYSKLRLSHPELTPNDLKHCALIRLNLSLSESASLLGISSESVRMSRFRIQKKLELQSQQALIDFLLKL